MLLERLPYVTFAGPASWPAALAHCRLLNGSLATVRSADENAALGGLLGNSVLGVWLGGCREGGAAPWAWRADDAPLAYANWAAGEPNDDAHSHCLQRWHTPGQPLFDGRWAARPCWYQLPFACERVLTTAAGALEPPP